MEFSGSRVQALFIAVGVHGEAAVAAAPVVAVGGKTATDERKAGSKGQFGILRYLLVDLILSEQRRSVTVHV